VLRDSQTFWDAHAARDPLWAVLSDAGRDGRRWDVRRFLQTGVNELALVFYELESHGIEVRHGTALDFGCGVGRLTQALARRFDRVIGVDVSSGMVEAAASLNRVPDRASFVWNTQPDLRVLDDVSFDFVYTNLVLQHIEPSLTREYLREFLRVLRPSGVLVFQLPSHERSENEPVPASAAAPMPDEAYRAAISLEGLPRVLKAATPFTLEARVTNISRFVWSRQAFGAITVGNHWLSPAGDRVLQRDDGRTPLPDSLAPGATTWVPLTINAPAIDGEYQCEFDLAHEGVRWFEDRGSEVVRVPITVAGDHEGTPITSTPDAPGAIADDDVTSGAVPSSAPGDLSRPDPGDFPMHGVHTDEVTRLIAASGGDVLMTRDDPSCGARWVSYRYFVRKGGGHDVG
jgi:SAM-dependent methyltransferase